MKSDHLMPLPKEKADTQENINFHSEVNNPYLLWVLHAYLIQYRKSKKVFYNYRWIISHT